MFQAVASVSTQQAKLSLPRAKMRPATCKAHLPLKTHGDSSYPIPLCQRCIFDYSCTFIALRSMTKCCGDDVARA